MNGVAVANNATPCDLPPLDFLATRKITGRVIDKSGKPVAKTGVYAKARKSQNINDFAQTNDAGEFTLRGFPTGYSPDYCQVGEQHLAKEARIVSKIPLFLQMLSEAIKYAQWLDKE